VHHAEFLCRIVADGRLEVVAEGDHLMLFTEADAILAALAAEIRTHLNPSPTIRRRSCRLSGQNRGVKKR